MAPVRLSLTGQAHPPGPGPGRGRPAPFACARPRVKRPTSAAGRLPEQGCGRTGLGSTRPAVRASWVRSARRRQPVLSRIRSRCEDTVRTLVHSWAGRSGRWCGPARPGDQLPFPGAEPAQSRRLLLRAGVLGEHQGLLGRVGTLIAAPRSSATRVRAGPSAWRASLGPCRSASIRPERECPLCTVPCGEDSG
jgi:hypothetical protein